MACTALPGVGCGSDDSEGEGLPPEAVAVLDERLDEIQRETETTPQETTPEETQTQTTPPEQTETLPAPEQPDGGTGDGDGDGDGGGSSGGGGGGGGGLEAPRGDG